MHMWDHDARNGVQQMWAVASGKQRQSVMDRFVVAFVVYLGFLDV